MQLRGNDWGRFSFKWWQWNNNSDVTSPIRRNRYHPSIVVIVTVLLVPARDPTWDSLSNLVTQFLPFLESLARLRTRLYSNRCVTRLVMTLPVLSWSLASQLSRNCTASYNLHRDNFFRSLLGKIRKIERNFGEG